MYNPRIFKAAAVAVPGTLVPVLLVAWACVAFYRHPVFGTMLFGAALCWVFMLAYYAGHDFVDTFWGDE